MDIKKVFCVIDPTKPEQPALVRSVGIVRNTGATLHAYICIPVAYNVSAEDKEAMREVELERHEAWLEKMLAPFREKDCTITYEVEASEDWRSALAPAAERAGADLIVKPSYQRTAIQRRFVKTSDWTLLREAKCPVLFVKSGQMKEFKKILLAVNLAAKDPKYVELNDKVIAYGKAVADLTDAELHVVNAYEGSENFIHPPDIAKRAGTTRDRVHVGDAEPEEWIAEVSDKLDGPLVIIGTMGRTGMNAAVVGNTAERILDKLNTDILVITKGKA